MFRCSEGSADPAHDPSHRADPELHAQAVTDGGATYELIRVADHVVHPGVSSDEGDGDEWPRIHEKILAAEILVLATPIWLGQPSSVSKRVLERMDAMLSETDADGRPVAFERVAGFVVTGNEDGAHHVVAELAQGLFDIGYTVPGQSSTYWHLGPGPGPTTSTRPGVTTGPTGRGGTRLRT
jgi:multimeric flavodoxin WrbA